MFWIVGEEHRGDLHGPWKKEEHIWN
jgi:hypothetical protein